MPPRLSLSLMGLVLLCSCATQHPVAYRLSTPSVRQQQRDQIAELLPGSHSLLRTIASRTVMIRANSAVKNSSKLAQISGGRGFAIAPDGYYLTALHVTQVGPFHLSETGRGNARYPGRVVWKNHDLDLAIVHFPRSTRNYFQKFATVSHGTLLATADDAGIDLPQSSSGPVGNGPYRAAGRVTLQWPARGIQGASSFMCDLISRQGMSGAPLVNQHGAVCGVISRVVFPKPNQAPQTTAHMIPASKIRRIIEKDRASRD